MNLHACRHLLLLACSRNFSLLKKKNSQVIVVKLVIKFVVTREHEILTSKYCLYSCIGNPGVVIAPPWPSEDADYFGSEVD